MTGQTWLIIGASTLVTLGVGVFILTRTSWFRVRKYAMDLKKIYEKHDLQKKTEAVQAVGQNPNPVLAKRPLRDLIGAYQGLIADLEKVKVPTKAQPLHDESLKMHRESLSLYQMATVGGFRQKSMVDKQRKLQQMERSVTQKMEALYGPLKKPKT